MSLLKPESLFTASVGAGAMGPYADHFEFIDQMPKERYMLKEQL